MRVLPVAAAATTGYLPLTLNGLNRGDHQVGTSRPADVLVPSAALDELLDGLAIDVVKVDTQGFDHEVLAGMRELFARASPVVMCEFWVEGMDERGLDADKIADAYERDFAMQLLDEEGARRAADAPGLLAAARTAPGGFVNVVLTPRR